MEGFGVGGEMEGFGVGGGGGNGGFGRESLPPQTPSR